MMKGRDSTVDRITTIHATTAERLELAVRESFPKLDESEQRISLALYRALANGRPVALPQLAESPGLPGAVELAAVVDAWPAVYRNDQGEVIGYWGLALGGTGHAIEVRGVSLTTWCAWDTLFLPEVLQADINVDSMCPVSGKHVRLQVGPTGVVSSDPSSPVLSFLDPTGKVDDGVISSFCHYIHFFADRRAGEQWISSRPNGLLLDLKQGWHLARVANRARYPSFLT